MSVIWQGVHPTTWLGMGEGVAFKTVPRVLSSFCTGTVRPLARKHGCQLFVGTRHLCFVAAGTACQTNFTWKLHVLFWPTGCPPKPNQWSLSLSWWISQAAGSYWEPCTVLRENTELTCLLSGLMRLLQPSWQSTLMPHRHLPDQAGLLHSRCSWCVGVPEIPQTSASVWLLRQWAHRCNAG